MYDSEKTHNILASVFSKDVLVYQGTRIRSAPEVDGGGGKTIDLRSKSSDPFFSQPETRAALAKFWEACFEIRALPERIAERMMEEQRDKGAEYVRETEAEPLEQNRDVLRDALEKLLGAVNSGATLEEAKQSAYSALALKEGN